ncbi:MAG: hypothetical protein QNK23_00575 [Crocinitomicaceae bacterium]|nr:hypothetical protein [Crocinitomicaceae bacterium]
MKKIIGTGLTFVAFTLMISSCGESIDGAALAQEVCDCTTAANGLPADDPNRSAEQDKCGELQRVNWDKVSGDTEQESAFNDQFPCGF